MSQDLDLFLSRRAVAAGWQWQAGALDTVGRRVTDVDDKGIPCAWTYTDGEHFAKPTGCYGMPETTGPYWASCLPDFRDAATRGVLLQQVRERWGDDYACVVPIDYGPGGIMWVCSLTAGGKQLTTAHFTNETAALVAALEAAPKEKGL